MSDKLLYDDLIFLDYKANNSKELLMGLAGILYSKGFVKESYINAIIDRENTYPTGLKTPGVNIAMPHTFPEHVNKPAILVATLKDSIPFHEMGNSLNTVDAKLIFMLAVTNPKGHLEILSKLMSIFSQGDKLLSLYNSQNPEELIGQLNGIFIKGE